MLEQFVQKIKEIPDSFRIKYSRSFRWSAKGYRMRFNRFGLDPNTVLSRWEDGSRKTPSDLSVILLNDIGGFEYWNMEALSSLEKQRPGISRVLYREYGILNYSRYPEELLVEQFDQRAITDKPYGVIIDAVADYNGSRLHYSNHNILRKLRSDLQGKYFLRIAEVDGKYGLARALIGLNNRYGETQKISFALLRGHGTRESVQLGSLADRGSLSLEDLKGESAKKVKDFFVPNPMIVITACHTGETNGLGERLAEVLQGRVMAPDGVSALESLNTSIDEASIILTPDYTNGVHTKFYSAKYKNISVWSPIGDGRIWGRSSSEILP